MTQMIDKTSCLWGHSSLKEKHLWARGRDIKRRNPYLWRLTLSPKDYSAVRTIAVHKLSSVSATHRDHCPSTVHIGGGRAVSQWDISVQHNRDTNAHQEWFQCWSDKWQKIDWIANDKFLIHSLLHFGKYATVFLLRVSFIPLMCPLDMKLGTKRCLA